MTSTDPSTRSSFTSNKKRTYTHVLFFLFVLGSMGYFLWGIRDVLYYHFFPQPTVELGDAEDFNGKWPHNQFVKIRVITDDRAARAKWVRGFALSREYWYFHIQGAPLFIELPTDPNQKVVGPHQEASLTGRLIHLKQGSEYEKLLSFFSEKFKMRLPESVYLLQVGVEPNEHWKYLGVIAFCIGMTLFNAYYLIRHFRKQRMIQVQEME